MNNIPNNQKYIIFLKAKFFKPRFFKSFYKRFRNSLENRGIILFNLEETIREINLLNPNIAFDDEKYPNPNILYIHLFAGQYFNDNIYSNRKLTIEREMLFLLAGKLGVNVIDYDTQITYIEYSKSQVGMKAKGYSNSIEFEKNIIKTTTTNRKEEYLNRGAPIYLESNSIKDVEKDIENNLGSLRSNVFNFDFYKINKKLESFVYKRFEFKMSALKYTLESEDISDISVSVRTCFSDFGFNIEFKKIRIATEKIHYTFVFFSDKDLKIEHFTNKKIKADPFYIVREQYESVDNKNLAVQYIIEYVTKLAKECFYRIKNGCGVKYNYSKKLLEFIKNNNDGVFYDICHQFHSTLQIKNWIYTTLSENSFEIINDYDENNKIERINSFKNTGEMHGFITSPQRQYKEKLENEEKLENSSKNNPYFIVPLTSTSVDDKNEIKILESSILNLNEEIESIKKKFESKTKIYNELIQTNQVELDLCNSKIILLENKIFKNENKNSGKKIKQNEITDDETNFKLLRTAKIEKNNLEKIIKSYQNELEEISNELLHKQSIYDEKIIIKNRFEETLLN
jgi:hypothetical protein